MIYCRKTSSLTSLMTHYLNQYNQRFFQERKISFRSNSVYALMNMISSSDLVGFVPNLIYNYFKDFLQLKSIISPTDLPDVTLYMLYNRSSLNNSNFTEFISRISP